MAITSAFQADDAGSIPAARSKNFEKAPDYIRGFFFSGHLKFDTKTITLVFPFQQTFVVEIFQTRSKQQPECIAL